MDKFEQYKLNLEWKNKDLVLKYLQKIKNFVEKNSIEKELYNDIEEMVFEKLSTEDNLDQLKIIKILKEVWEPEVIFSDYVVEKETKKEDIQGFYYEKLIENWWFRDNKNAIILWICWTIAEKVWVSVWSIRILFLVFSIFAGFWLSIYLVLWILMPVRWINYTWKTNFWYLRIQLILAIRHWIFNVSSFFMKNFGIIINKIFKIFKAILRNILPLFRFLFFCFIWFLFTLFLFWLIVVLAWYFTSFSIENIDFVSFFPNYFIWALIFWIVSLSIFSVFCFVYWISKKVINTYVLSIWWISFLVALFLVISTWFDLVQKFSSKNEYIQNSEINIENSYSWGLVINISWIFNEHIISNFWWTPKITFETSSWNILKAQIKNVIYWDEKILKMITDWLSNINLENADNKINITLENNKIFKKKVPFSFFERNLIIYIPEWITFQIIPSYWYYFENVSLDEKYKKYEEFLYQDDCKSNKITYNKEEKKFICVINENDLAFAKKEYLQKYIIENFDNISPLIHKKMYKNNYYNNYWFDSDRNFEKFNWEDEKNLYFNFFDNSLNIYASLQIEETSTWITINDFSIKNVIVEEDYFDEKYYDDIWIIKDYLYK